MSEIHMTQAKKKYLTVLYDLDPSGKGIRSIEVCKKLNVSRPSVHSMLDKLALDGFVKKEYYGIIYLTDAGLEYGSKLSAENK